MNLVWQVLAGNLATVALILSIWMHLSYRLYRMSPAWQRVGFGGILGFAAIASMLLSVEFEPGIYFDLRLALIEVSAVFGGPVSLGITAVMTIAFRIFLGGAGVVPGVIGIVISSVIGLVMWQVAGRRPIERPPAILAVAGVAAALGLAVLALLPPQLFRSALEAIGLPIAVLNFMTTGASGLLITYFRRFTLERDILYAALTQAPDYYYVKDLDHRFVVTNLNVARHNGRDRSSLMVGLSDFDLVPEQRARELYEAERKVLETGETISHFEEYLIEEGNWARWYSTSKVPLRNRHGELLGLAGVTVDITDKKRFETEYQSSREVMAQAMAEMSDGLAMFDAADRLVFCNDQYQALFPRSAYARQPGAHISDIVRAVVRNGERKDVPTDASEESIQAAAATLHTNQDEVIPLFDGRWLAMRTRVGENGSALVVVSDITAMKESELSLRKLADQMKGLAQTDGLTELANRRYFDTALATEFSRASRTGSPLSLLLIDVDRFKLFNDAYGHLAGDSCLIQIAGCLEASAERAADLAARFGGEEFAVLLPETNAEAAVAIADRLREGIRELSIEHGGSEFGIVTASIGVAILTPESLFSTPAELIGCADAALYRSKDAGRDRTSLMRLGNQRQARPTDNIHLI
ncbi:diguanylate cyclase [Rhizobium sp. PL01]|uniref:diguanylate cyclase n=1 Tax=Rhizobium sp. PL01 TaxID=3085631 RepID=UPI002981F96B|nr:diguanylate cyclase [Rhizobium sp. PL01]MDW5316149.1 diguanylate cyclase [Rhizobium sp. PL01]